MNPLTLVIHPVVERGILTIAPTIVNIVTNETLIKTMMIDDMIVTLDQMPTNVNLGRLEREAKVSYMWPLKS
jgi:hypothetical protein